MPVLRQIPLNPNTGAFEDIFASIPCRMIEMMEDEAGAAQGLQIKSLLDNFATTNVFTFGSEPLQIPNAERYKTSVAECGCACRVGGPQKIS
jgi:hypothetical protein